MKVNLYKYLIFSGLLLFTACSKTPESILSPSIKIQLDKATGSYILLFTAGIKTKTIPLYSLISMEKSRLLTITKGK